jgi:hypothetical protein
MTMQINPTVREMVPFSFRDVELKEACWLNGKPHYTRRSIGEFLGYAGSQSQKAVDKIIERNTYIRQWGSTVKLTVEDFVGSTSRTREIETVVYDPIGLQLITFESRQPKAREYKVAVAHLVWAYMNGQLRPPVDPSYLGKLRAIEALPWRQRGLAIRMLAQSNGCSKTTILSHRALVREGRDPSQKRYWTSMDYWDRRFTREKALVMAGLAERWTAVRIWREALSAPAKPSLYMVRSLAHRLAQLSTPLCLN